MAKLIVMSVTGYADPPARLIRDPNATGQIWTG